MPKSKVRPFPYRVKDLTSRKFSRLTVISFSHVNDRHRAIWLCSCSCGVTKLISGSRLIVGDTKSCGCWQRENQKEVMRKTAYKHGHASTTTKGRSAEYGCWSGLKDRCLNKNHHTYHRYGGKGVKLCKRWRNSFVNFLADVGEKPGPEYSLDRIDNGGNYEPGNVRWATHKEQQRNKRNNRILEFQGERLCVSEWAEKLGVPRERIAGRLNRGWSDEKTLSTPPHFRRSKLDRRGLRADGRGVVMKFTIKEIHIPLGILVPVPPLEVCAVLDEEWSVWLFEDKQLNIDASGNDEDELREAIRIEMDVLWRAYAMAEDSTLDFGAIELKNALRQRFRFVGIMG